MKLNHDCLRDTLLALEEMLILSFEETEFGPKGMEYVFVNGLHAQLQEYSLEEVCYSLKMLSQAGLIETLEENDCWMAPVKGMTFAGHEYLEKIRPKTVWEKTKGIAGNIGSFSISVLSDIASSVISDAISGKSLNTQGMLAISVA